MNTTEGIVLLKEKVAGTKDAMVFQDAERILVDNHRGCFAHGFFSRRCKHIERKSAPPKKPLDMEEAMNALAKLQKLGTQYGVDIPTFEDKTQFGLWLLTDYGRSLLNYG